MCRKPLPEHSKVRRHHDNRTRRTSTQTQPKRNAVPLPPMRQPGRRDATADRAGRELDGWRAGGGGKNLIIHALNFDKGVYL